MKRYFALIALLFSLPCLAQVDTEFWFALPAVSSNEPMFHRLDFQSYDTAANIQIEIFWPGSTTTLSLSMAPQQHQRCNLGTPAPYTPNAAQYRGIHITSTASVSCVYDIFTDSLRTIGERYTLKGSNALGTKFVVPAPLEILDYNVAHNSIEMIATEDNTVAVIDIPATAWDGPPRSWSHDTVRLQRGQSYIVRTDTTSYDGGSNPVGILSASFIRTNKPIALNSSDAVGYDSNGYAPAPAGEQLVPAHLLGSKFIVTYDAIHCDDPFRRINFDTIEYAFAALYDNTTIRTLGSFVSTHTIQRGQLFYMMHHYNGGGGYPGTAFKIESDKPIAMISVLCHNHRLSYTMTPHVECTGSRQIAAYSAIDADNRFNYFLLGPARARTHALVNGAPPQGASWSYWHDYGDYVLHDQVTIDTPQRILATIDSGLVHLYTWNRGERSRFYTCHSEYAPQAYLAFDMGFTEFTSGDTVLFRYVHRNMEGLRFTGPGGIRIDNPADTIQYVVDPRFTGWYYLRGATVEGCTDSIIDSVYITVSPVHGEVFDTVAYDICRSQLPFTIDTLTFDTAGTFVKRYPGSHGFDSIVTYIITLIPDSDTALADTIYSSQLPWTFLGHTFDDTVTGFVITTTNARGCDSIIRYSLHIRYSDSLFYYICANQLPFTIDSLTFDDAGTQTLRFTGSGGEDSMLVYTIQIIPGSETYISDTIVESQLPWFFFDTLFSDTVDDHLFATYNEAGCDSIIHYSLHIFWEGDHCDTTLSYPNVVTPNGDGINDRFVIGGLLENSCYKYSELTIYDRTGHRVYHRKNIAYDTDWWDPGAQRIPAGTYFYIFKAHGIYIRTQHIGVIEVLTGK